VRAAAALESWACAAKLGADQTPSGRTYTQEPKRDPA